MIATLSFAADSMRGILRGDDSTFDGVSIDSRTIQAGELFVALSGPNFDGKKFVGQARGKGAVAAVVDSAVADEIVQIEVDDARFALGQLGATWRGQHSVTVIGITGSNGKTTLKELTAACLSAVAPTLATQGNIERAGCRLPVVGRIDGGDGGQSQ